MAASVLLTGLVITPRCPSLSLFLFNLLSTAKAISYTMGPEKEQSLGSKACYPTAIVILTRLSLIGFWMWSTQTSTRIVTTMMTRMYYHHLKSITCSLPSIYLPKYID